MVTSDAPLVARPRPPRSKSARLGSSQSSSKGSINGSNTLDAFGAPKDGTSTSNASHAALIGALETLTPPATPPLAMTSCMEPLDDSNKPTDAPGPFTFPEQDLAIDFEIAQMQRENSHQNMRSPEELENMLEEARRIIEERETELGIAASIGKSLLDSNIALRAKQDALLRRVEDHANYSPRLTMRTVTSPATSPTSTKGKERASHAQIVPFPSLHIPKAYGARGEYVEGRPPPSPRHSIGRSRSRTSIDYKGDISTLHSHQRTASSSSTSSQRKISTMSSPPRGSGFQSFGSPLRQSQGHYRRSSSSSTLGHESTTGFTSISRSSSTKSIIEVHNANIAHQRQLSEDIQRLQLSEQNAELESRLQDLEYQVTRADATGRKKLRRLDKELLGLKRELESALERNKELEEKLDQRQAMKTAQSGVPKRDTESSFHLPEVRVRTESGILDDLETTKTQPSANILSMPTDTDTDTSLVSETNKTSEIIGNATLGSNSDLPSGAYLQPIDLDTEPLATGQIVSQLVAKIYELQEANSQISARKEDLNEQLTAASTQFNDMRRKYEFLEERVIEAEIRNHRILELEDGGEAISEDALLGIEWRQDSNAMLISDADSVSPATKIQRKAVGNRPRIEQYRRFSSLYGSQAGSDILLNLASAYTSPPRRGTSGPSNSRDVTPQRDASCIYQDITSSSSKSSRLSVSPARSASSTTSKRRSRAGSFFDTEATEEDIITSMQRKLQAERDAFERDHAPLTSEDSEHDLCTEATSAFPNDVFLRFGHHSLASEMGIDNTSPDTLSLDTPEDTCELSHFAATSTSNVLHKYGLEGRDLGIRASRSSSTRSLVPAHRSGDLEHHDEEEDNLGGLMPEGPADAQSYDDLQATLEDLAVRWEDDLVAIRGGGMMRIEGAPASRPPERPIPTWGYEDGDSDNSDNDPWKEETERHHSIESSEQVQAREKAEARSLQKRRRLEELAREMLEDEESDSSQRIEDKLALVKVESNDSEVAIVETTVRRGHSLSQTSSDYEQVEIEEDAAGADYLPVAYRARYSPAVVAMRVQKTSQEYLNMCLLWTRFLAVLAVAVVFSIWRGPEAGLGVSGRRRKQLQPSEVAPSKSSVIVRRHTKSDQ